MREEVRFRLREASLAYSPQFFLIRTARYRHFSIEKKQCLMFHERIPKSSIGRYVLDSGKGVSQLVNSLESMSLFLNETSFYPVESLEVRFRLREVLLYREGVLLIVQFFLIRTARYQHFSIEKKQWLMFHEQIPKYFYREVLLYARALPET